MRRFLAKHFHIVIGAKITGPTFYGLVWPRFGFGFFIGEKRYLIK